MNEDPVVRPSSPSGVGPGPTPGTRQAPDKTWHVLWTYAADAWAATACRPLAAPGKPTAADVTAQRRHAMLIADGVTFRSAPAEVPFKAGYLPAGLTLMSGSGFADPSAAGRLGLDTLTYEFDDPDRAVGHRSALTILTRPDRYPLISGPDVEPITINGRRAAIAGSDSIEIVYGGFHLVIYARNSDITRDTLIRIAENLEIAADPADRSTWFDPGLAFP
jgi:hypothetical protein